MSETTTTRRALAFIFITVLIDMIGFGIVVPVLPELIMELTGEGLGDAALYGGGLLFVYALMQFFFAPIIGNLSDRFGRRPVLLLSLLAFGLDYVLMGLAPSIGWLFAGRMIAGISGATHSTANAYIADVSPPGERAQNFGLVGAAFGLGFILGPVLGGILGEYGPRVPFFAAAGLAWINMIYGFLVVPETLPESERRPFAFRRANPFGALAQMGRYPLVVGLLAAMVLYQIAHDANPSVWSYYTMLKFDWSEKDVGYSLGFVGLMVALVQGGLIRAAMPRLGERRAVFFGYSMMSLGFMGFALSTESWMLYAFIVPFALGGLGTPALRSLMANEVPANAQGELAGAITSVMSLTAIVAPLMLTSLFSYFTRENAPIHLPGAPYVLASVLMVLSLLLVARVTSRMATPPGGKAAATPPA